jgi:hypothetical protein
MGAWKAVRRLAVAVALLAGAAGPTSPAQGGSTLSPDYLDQLLAPVALYPDQLLAQVLLCSGNPSKVGELAAWLKQMSKVKGTALQEAAQKAGFEPSFVALAPFPQVVDLMAGNPKWTSQLGGAFAVDRGAVFDSIQRLRKQSQAAGNLKSTPQQTVESRTTQGGEQVIVIEPANPQVVYVPQYNPQVVYTQPASTTVPGATCAPAATHAPSSTTTPSPTFDAMPTSAPSPTRPEPMRTLCPIVTPRPSTRSPRCASVARIELSCTLVRSPIAMRAPPAVTAQPK